MVVLPFKPEDLQVFQTPGRVLALMLQNEPFCQADFRQMVDQAIALRMPYRCLPVLYAMDHPNLEVAVCSNEDEAGQKRDDRRGSGCDYTSCPQNDQKMRISGYEGIAVRI